MKLWIISQDANRGYDTYDSAVVAAYTEAAAKLIHPAGPGKKWNEHHEKWIREWERDLPGREVYGDDTWAAPAFVEVKLIGEAVDGTMSGVICASFNAG